MRTSARFSRFVRISLVYNDPYPILLPAGPTRHGSFTCRYAISPTSLSPSPTPSTERMQAINSPNATIVRSMRTKLSQSGCDKKLDRSKDETSGAATTRGRHFQTIAQLLYLISRDLTPTKGKLKLLEPNTSRIEVFLNEPKAVSQAASVAVEEVLTILCQLVDDPLLGPPLTKGGNKLSPVEFVMVGFLIYLYRKTHSLEQLSDAVDKMRKNVRNTHRDVRFNSVVFKHLLEFVYAVKDKKLQGDGYGVPAVRILDSNASNKMKKASSASAPVVKRKRADPDDEDAKTKRAKGAAPSAPQASSSSSKRVITTSAPVPSASEVPQRQPTKLVQRVSLALDTRAPSPLFTPSSTPNVTPVKRKRGELGDEESDEIPLAKKVKPARRRARTIRVDSSEPEDVNHDADDESGMDDDDGVVVLRNGPPKTPKTPASRASVKLNKSKGPGKVSDTVGEDKGKEKQSPGKTRIKRSSTSGEGAPFSLPKVTGETKNTAKPTKPSTTSISKPPPTSSSSKSAPLAASISNPKSNPSQPSTSKAPPLLRKPSQSTAAASASSKPPLAASHKSTPSVSARTPAAERCSQPPTQAPFTLSSALAPAPTPASTSTSTRAHPSIPIPTSTSTATLAHSPSPSLPILHPTPASSIPQNTNNGTNTNSTTQLANIPYSAASVSTPTIPSLPAGEEHIKSERSSPALSHSQITAFTSPLTFHLSSRSTSQRQGSEAASGSPSRLASLHNAKALVKEQREERERQKRMEEARQAQRGQQKQEQQQPAQRSPDQTPVLQQQAQHPQAQRVQTQGQTRVQPQQQIADSRRPALPASTSLTADPRPPRKLKPQPQRDEPRNQDQEEDDDQEKALQEQIIHLESVLGLQSRSSTTPISPNVVQHARQADTTADVASFRPTDILAPSLARKTRFHQTQGRAGRDGAEVPLRINTHVDHQDRQPSISPLTASTAGSVTPTPVAFSSVSANIHPSSANQSHNREAVPNPFPNANLPNKPRTRPIPTEPRSWMTENHSPPPMSVSSSGSFNTAPERQMSIDSDSGRHGGDSRGRYTRNFDYRRERGYYNIWDYPGRYRACSIRDRDRGGYPGSNPEQSGEYDHGGGYVQQYFMAPGLKTL